MSVKLLKRRFPSGSVRLYLDINSNGKRTKEALGFTLDGDRFQNRETLKMAEEIRAQRELRLHEQNHGVLSTNKRKQSFTDYLERLIETRESVNTKHSWRNALHHFQTYSQGDVVFGQLTREYLEGFKSFLLKEAGLKSNSAQIYFSRIKTALHQAVRDGIVTVNSATFITIKKDDRHPTYLTLAEIKLLSKTPLSNEHVKNAFLFSCFSGLRYSDIINLTWDKVKGDQIHFTQKKTGAPEILPLSMQALKLLTIQNGLQPSQRVKARPPDNAVFSLPRQSVVDKHLKKWAIRAKLEKSISMHVGRHTFATLAISQGIDIYTTSKLLGHKNLHSTQIYAKVMDESKRMAIVKLPMLDH